MLTSRPAQAARDAALGEAADADHPARLERLDHAPQRAVAGRRHRLELGRPAVDRA